MPVWDERVRFRSHPPDPRLPPGVGAYVGTSYPAQPPSAPSQPLIGPSQPVMGPFHPSVNYEQEPRFYGQTYPPSDVKYLGIEEEYYGPHAPLRFGNNVIFDPFQLTYVEAFKKLSPEKKFEYGLKYGELEELPVGKWRSYEGGVDYLRSLPKFEQKQLLSEFMKSESWKDFISSPGGLEQFKDVRSSIAREGLGPLDLVLVETVPTTEVEKRLAERLLFTVPESFERVHWESLDVHTRFRRLAKEGVVSGGLAIPTLVEMGLHWGFGTPTPVGTWQQERFVSYTPGLIEAPISEVLSGGESPSFERLGESPERLIESSFKTGASFFGLMAGGGLYGLGKMGLKKATGPVVRGIESRFGIPSLGAYRPTNLLRKVWWKGKEKLGRAEYLPEEQVWDPLVLSGEKRFAELHGAGRQLRVFEKTRLLNLFPEEDIMGIHATGHRFHKIIYIQKGTSKSPGLSVSAFGRGSPHFLRASGSYSSSMMPTRISLFPQLYMPTAPVFYLKKVFRFPKYIRSSLEKSADYLKGLKSGSYAHIAPKVEMGGPEIEAIIKKGTWGVRSKSYLYTTYKGVVVPLPEYKLFGKWLPKGVAVKASDRIPSGVKDFLSLSYQSSPSISLVSPSMFASKMSSFSKSFYSSSLVSSSVSKLLSSYGISRSMSSVPSSINSYISKPSYKSYISKPSPPSIPSIPSIPSPPSYPPYLPSGSDVTGYEYFLKKKKKLFGPSRWRIHPVEIDKRLLEVALF